MVKKNFLAIFVFTLLFSLFNFYSIVLAQGNCSSGPAAGMCDPPVNNCDFGYSPQVGAFPDCDCDCREGGIRNPFLAGRLSELSGAEFVSKLISFGIAIGFTVAAVGFVLMFIMGGIRWITSQGDKARVEQARNQITHALIGLLLTFALFVILGIIEDFFGISLRQFNLPSLTD